MYVRVRDCIRIEHGCAGTISSMVYRIERKANAINALQLLYRIPFPNP